MGFECRSDANDPMRNRMRKTDADPLRCPRCRLHTDLCACRLLTPTDVAAQILLVTHKFEHRKATNTGHLAVQCLKGARLCLRGREDSPDDPVVWDPDRTPLFLFPCRDAVPLDTWHAAQATKPTAISLIVPDGTWRQANRVRRRVPGLADIQAVSLPSPQQSYYQLRHTHVGSRLATFEAIALALGILEGPAIETHLLHVFRAIVDRALWSNGRLATDEVTGGIPVGARQDGPAKGVLQSGVLQAALADE
jgi:DTW domain-containing protein YfiP